MQDKPAEIKCCSWKRETVVVGKCFADTLGTQVANLFSIIEEDDFMYNVGLWRKIAILNLFLWVHQIGSLQNYRYLPTVSNYNFKDKFSRRPTDLDFDNFEPLRILSESDFENFE